MTLTNYLNLIKEQRLKTPKHPKDYRVITLSTKTTDSSYELDKLSKWKNAKLCKIIYREESLFEDVEDNFYFEFVETNGTIKSSFIDWRFFYIPLSKKDLILEKLPFIYYYSKEEEKVEKIYPSSQLLVEYPRPSNTFFVKSFTNNTHPFLKNFIFTGTFFIKSNGDIMYEYQDYNMFSDHISITYYSSYRPLNFYLPSGVVSSYGLETLAVNRQYVRNYPSYLELYSNVVPNLKFTGRTTTKSFHTSKRWYEYTMYIEGNPYEKILLSYPPYLENIDFVDIQLNSKRQSMLLPLRDNTQSISISQHSNNSTLYLN
jgi:hypothetical protein